MDMPIYDGVLEKWKINLIMQRAKLLGFRPHELPDALQETALVVLEFEYEPDHVNGASEKTALTAIIDNRLRKMKRSDARHRMRIEQLGLFATEYSCDEVSLVSIDLIAVVSELSPRERAVCCGLAMGLNINQIARELGCNWHVVKRLIRRLKESFQAFAHQEAMS